MEIFSQHFWQWLIFLALFIFAIYTMFVIKNEGQSFEDDSSPMDLGEIILKIPKWWTLVSDKKNSYRFERTDTRYEWYAQLDFIQSTQSDDSNNEREKIQNIFDSYLEKQKVSFDPDVTVTTEPSHLFFTPEVSNQITECLRVEGMGTQDRTKRIYWDVYLFRINGRQDYYILESWSSVLNGMLEGPYFEESVSRLEIKKPLEKI